MITYWTQPYPRSGEHARVVREVLRGAPVLDTRPESASDLDPFSTVSVSAAADDLRARLVERLQATTPLPAYTYLDPWPKGRSTAWSMFEAEIAELHREIARVVTGFVDPDMARQRTPGRE